MSMSAVLFIVYLATQIVALFGALILVDTLAEKKGNTKKVLAVTRIAKIFGLCFFVAFVSITTLTYILAGGWWWVIPAMIGNLITNLNKK